MKKQLLLLSIIVIANFSQSQTYQWDWAQSGGGTQSVTTSGSSFDFGDFERVTSIKVDNNNNYYFLAISGGGTSTFEGVPYTNYEDTPSGGDIFLFSTTCDGVFRWKKTIGSTDNDRAFSVAVDSNNNIYVAGRNGPFIDATNNPIRFDTDVVLNNSTGPSGTGEQHRAPYIIKYSDQGIYQWLYFPQDPSFTTSNSPTASYEMFVDSMGNSHWLMAINQGTHDSGNIVVTDPFQWIILKVDTAGNYVGHIDAKIGGGVDFDTIRFHYDELLDRYYLGLTSASISNRITYDNVIAVGFMSLIAVDNTGNQIWRKDNLQGGFLRDIITDDQSNIYFCGMNNNVDSSMSGAPNDSMAGYSFTQSSTSSGNGVPANFLIKLNAAGNLLWGTNNDSFAVEPAHTIVLNGNEVAIGAALIDTTWAGLSFVRGNNSNYDPVVVRFNASTGSIIAIEDIRGDIGLEDSITAIALDNFGNYVVGGYMRGNLFVNNDPNVPQINKTGGNADFWIARLAQTDCQGVPLSIEENIESGFKLYPNPASDRVQIEALGNTVLIGYNIYSITGQLVQHGSTSESAVYINDLTAGMYLIEILGEGDTKEVIKLIKK
ncbi:T9SS type A sorting domain-containing protein [Nonlabens ulvanivorans]|uniref:T9SS type A sorting domain-containing protein n=1 Tax=Nonlabens ulvanivorans TaxID=906888 RepID=UPI0037C5CA14